MELSMIIRDSPLRDDYLKAASRYKLDPVWDIGHVREKYGSAKRGSDWLLERLGKSITQRRQYLKYRKEHHKKLSDELDEETEDIEGNEDEKLEETIAETKDTKTTRVIEGKYEPRRDGEEAGGVLLFGNFLRSHCCGRRCRTQAFGAATSDNGIRWHTLRIWKAVPMPVLLY
jgi:hypothetical protein